MGAAAETQRWRRRRRGRRRRRRRGGAPLAHVVFLLFFVLRFFRVSQRTTKKAALAAFRLFAGFSAWWGSPSPTNRKSPRPPMTKRARCRGESCTACPATLRGPHQPCPRRVRVDWTRDFFLIHEGNPHPTGGGGVVWVGGGVPGIRAFSSVASLLPPWPRAVTTIARVRYRPGAWP